MNAIRQTLVGSNERRFKVSKKDWTFTTNNSGDSVGFSVSQDSVTTSPFGK